MIEEQDQDLELYEEWIAHPDRRVFVPKKAHTAYAQSAGWWCTDWQGDEDAVYARGYKPQR